MEIYQLNTSAFTILKTIADLQPSQRQKVSVQELATTSKVHVRTVQRYLPSLKALGYINFSPVRGRGRLYSFTVDRRVRSALRAKRQ